MDLDMMTHSVIQVPGMIVKIVIVKRCDVFISTYQLSGVLLFQDLGKHFTRQYPASDFYRGSLIVLYVAYY